MTPPEANAHGPAPVATERPRIDWLRLFLEFVIVVAGISISFWFQDQRTDRAKRTEEARYLAGFRAELAEDLNVLKKRTESQVGVVEGLRKATSAEERETLGVAELDAVMDSALTYAGFRGSMATYAELRQTGGSSLVRDKALLSEVIHLYERDYPQAREWDAINRQFVLERMFPYIEDFGPRVNGTIEGTVVTGYHVIFTTLEHEDRFQNLLLTNKTFKEGQIFVYKDLAAKIERVIGLLKPQP